MTVDKIVKQNTYYHLRRIGRPPTKSNVKNIFVLRSDVTRFGRHSGNDNYIDSAVLDCFISRWHSEILRILHNGTVHYVLKDKSLNGTYVNNHRVQGNHVLQDGEVICFGHTNGKNIKPGEYAPQTDSEFEFVFERAPPDSDSDVEIVQEVSGRGQSPPVVDSTTGASDPHVHSVSHRVDEDLSRTLPSRSSTSGISSSVIGTTEDGSSRIINFAQKSAPQDRKSPVLQDISNKSTALSTTGLVPLDQIAAQAHDNRPAVSCNITVQVAEDKVFSPSSQGRAQADAGDSVQQALQSHDTTHRTTGPSHEAPHRTTGPSHEAPHRTTGPSHEAPHRTTGPSHEPPHRTTGPSHKPPHRTTSPSHEPPHRITGPSHEAPHRTTSPNHEAPHRTTGPNHEAPRRNTGPSHEAPHRITGPSHEAPEAGEPESRLHAGSSPEQAHSDNMHLTVDPSANMKTTPTADAISKQKRQTSGEASAKRKGKGKRRRSSETTEDDDERWHYAGDKCDAIDCSRPVGVKVSWVQCDDCDAWYHIQCAGCNYGKIKRKMVEFHCGCV